MRRVALAAAAAALLAPACAQAARGLETGIADDRVLLEHPEQAPAAVARWRADGVDVVRILARWVKIAPGPNQARMPAGFHPTDPNDPHYDWGALDRAVWLVRLNGMRVMLEVTGSGPLWSSQVPARGVPRLMPDPARFADFATAVARRYGALVDRYLIWNEPNQPGWLQPQFRCPGGAPAAPRGRLCTPASPGIYRALVRASYPAIRRADPGAQVLVGTLAPRGKDGTKRNVAMRPLEFLRAFGCVDARLHAVRSGSCAGFRTIPADGFAYHPHGVQRSPSEPALNPDDAAIADLPRLERTLDALTRTGAFAHRMDLYLTEFGYQTDPPDQASGVSFAKQALWLAQSAYIAWRDPRVRLLTQYEWRDEPIARRGPGADAFARWQSGLLRSDGRPKPALAQFPAPMWVDAPRARLWGMVRPGGAALVDVERRVAGSSAWTVLRRLRTGVDGAFTLPLPDARPADYRFVAVTGPADRPLVVRSAARAFRRAGSAAR